jgi:hypothetical protein
VSSIDAHPVVCAKGLGWVGFGDGIEIGTRILWIQSVDRHSTRPFGFVGKRLLQFDWMMIRRRWLGS